MLMSAKVRQMTFDGAATQVIRKQARSEGMTTLYDDGIIKAMQGLTTLEEVCRVAKKNED
jgi:type IV pilus assembly protein PilB